MKGLKTLKGRLTIASSLLALGICGILFSYQNCSKPLALPAGASIKGATSYEFPNSQQKGWINMNQNILLYHFNESAGSTKITDSSGYNNNVDCTTNQVTWNATVASSTPATCPSFGSPGIGVGSATFSPDTIFQLTNPLLDFSNGANLTYVMWLNSNYPPHAVTGNPNLVGSHIYPGLIQFDLQGNCYAAGMTNCGMRSPSMYLLDASYFQVQLGTGTAGGLLQLTSDSSQPPVSIPNGQWVHLAMTFDGQNFIQYINGQAINQVSTTLSQVSTTSLQFGEGGGYTISGQWDEVAIFKRALSASEIQLIYSTQSKAFAH